MHCRGNVQEIDDVYNQHVLQIKRFLVLFIAIVVLAPSFASAYPFVEQIGSNCKVVGRISGTDLKPLVCKKVAGRKIWVLISASSGPKIDVSAVTVPKTVTAPNAKASPFREGFFVEIGEPVFGCEANTQTCDAWESGLNEIGQTTKNWVRVPLRGCWSRNDKPWSIRVVLAKDVGFTEVISDTQGPASSTVAVGCSEVGTADYVGRDTTPDDHPYGIVCDASNEDTVVKVVGSGIYGFSVGCKNGIARTVNQFLQNVTVTKGRGKIWMKVEMIGNRTSSIDVKEIDTTLENPMTVSIPPVTQTPRITSVSLISDAASPRTTGVNVGWSLAQGFAITEATLEISPDPKFRTRYLISNVKNPTNPCIQRADGVAGCSKIWDELTQFKKCLTEGKSFSPLCGNKLEDTYFSAPISPTSMQFDLAPEAIWNCSKPCGSSYWNMWNVKVTLKSQKLVKGVPEGRFFVGIKTQVLWFNGQ